MNAAASLVVAASNRVDAVCLFAAKAALAGMVVVIGIQVVARYGLHFPPGWTEELARYLMVWGGLLGATAAFRRGIDPAVVTPAPDGKGALATAGKVILAVTVLIFICPILYYSFFGPGADLGRSFLMRNYARTSTGLGLNLVFIAAAIPAFCLVILLHLAARLIAGPLRSQVPKNAADII